MPNHMQLISASFGFGKNPLEDINMSVILSAAKNPVIRKREPAVSAHLILHSVQNDKLSEG
jgi:hypothetical protein